MTEIDKIGSDNRFNGDYIATRIFVAIYRIAPSPCGYWEGIVIEPFPGRECVDGLHGGLFHALKKRSRPAAEKVDLGK